MKYIITTDDLYGGDIYKSILLMGTNGKGEVIVQKFNLDELEELTADYINEHYGSLQDEAYQRGHKEGYAKGFEEGTLAAGGDYQRGLDDAWEATRKVAFNSDDGGLDIEALDEIFGCYSLQGVFKAYSAQQTIAKLKAYEEQKADDEIKVGDEVKHDRGWKAVVTSIDNIGFSVMDYNGEVGGYSDISKFTKTGRHFDIPKILEAMKA